MKVTDKDLKDAIQEYYAILGHATNYEEEKYIDAQIHKLKKELEKREIYVREKIKSEFVKIKQIGT